MFKFSSVFVLLLSQLAIAQTADLEVPEITVMGQSSKTSPMDYAPTISELSGQRLKRKQQSTIGETLSRETGVNSSQFGPNASRPVIRGLDGERIRILQNGTGVLDASAASQDHAVAIDPLIVDRIEIVRGPAALLYGSSAVGGVVNIVTRRIPELMPKALDAKLDSRYSTNDQGRSTSLAAETGVLGNWAFHFDGGVRAADNYHVPGLARTANERATNPLPVEDDKEVQNTFNRTWSGAVGTSYIFEKGFVGASYAQFASNYGTVAEKEVSLHMIQNRVDVAAGFRNLGWIESAKAKTSFSNYQHEEIENAAVGTTFKNRGNESRLELKHQKTAGLDGLFGLQANVFRFEALGDEKFLPATDNQTFSAFVFEEMTLGDFRPSLGLRGDFARVASDSDDVVRFGQSTAKNFDGGSASLGLIYALNTKQSLVFNSSYTERAPNYQELFANGQHVATRNFEIGSQGLGKERSQAAELSFRHKADESSASVGAFLQSFDDFIALSPTGAPDPVSGLPIFQYGAVKANLWGAEAEYRHRFEQLIPGGVVELELKGDFVKSRNEGTGTSLPRIPPLRETVGLAYQTDRYRLDGEVQRSERQTELATFETETPAYTVLNFGVEAPIELSQLVFNVFARANNVLDAEARNHVSILKEIAPLPGRNFTFGLQARF